ncbi:conserved hypothetical protein [Acidobacteriia bacterium SbA2]|nr:conserved hypothetical protein [Acidobacteriia bacterium SbA2]
MLVKFERDERKNEINIRKHGFDFRDAWEVFAGPFLVRLDQREDYGEDRWQGIGLLRGQVVVLIFTQRGPDIIRVISLRKARKHEREGFEKALQD